MLRNGGAGSHGRIEILGMTGLFAPNSLEGVWIMKRAENLIISHPRCGLNRIRQFLEHLGYTMVDFNARKSVKFKIGNRFLVSHCRLGMKRTSKSHVENALHGIYRYFGFRVVFLTRDPRDVMTSNHNVKVANLSRGRWRVSSGLSNFIRNDIIGLVPLLRWWKRWEKDIKDGCKIKVVRFEDVKSDPLYWLSDIVRFFCIRRCEEDILRAVDLVSTPEKVQLNKGSDVSVVNTTGGASGTWLDWHESDQKWALEMMHKYRSILVESYL